ncbi:MAG: hypothetical protein HY332_21245 [Chloroflexi bacterium]|nr:hypothetical protein [Chloroflexota bacterium]
MAGRHALTNPAIDIDRDIHDMERLIRYVERYARPSNAPGATVERARVATALLRKLQSTLHSTIAIKQQAHASLHFSAQMH